MIRWKFTFDKDDEQDWINEYCQQGWAMAGFFVGVVAAAQHGVTGQGETLELTLGFPQPGIFERLSRKEDK